MKMKIIMICIFSILVTGCSKEEKVQQVKEKTVPVIVQKAVKREFKNVYNVSGVVESKYSAVISARIPGTIDEISVDEGDSVNKETSLFQMDSVNLKNAFDIAQRQYDVAKLSVKERLVAQKGIVSAFKKAEIDYKRYKKLLKQGAVTEDAVESQKTRYDQALANKEHAEVLVELAKSQLLQSEVNLKIAEKNLSDSRIFSPINGVITHKYKEIGEMIGAGTPVVRVEDISVLEVSAYVPGELYSEIIVGKTHLDISIDGEPCGSYVCSYKSPRLDEKFRTFEIKCVVNDVPEIMVSGCIADLSVVLEKRTGFAVPAVSVMSRKNRKVILAAVDSKAHMITVKTGIENDNWIEITDGIDQPLDVISQGQTMLDHKDSVKIVEAK